MNTPREHPLNIDLFFAAQLEAVHSFSVSDVRENRLYNSHTHRIYLSSVRRVDLFNHCFRMRFRLGDVRDKYRAHLRAFFQALGFQMAGVTAFIFYHVTPPDMAVQVLRLRCSASPAFRRCYLSRRRAFVYFMPHNAANLRLTDFRYTAIIHNTCRENYILLGLLRETS